MFSKTREKGDVMPRGDFGTISLARKQGNPGQSSNLDSTPWIPNSRYSTSLSAELGFLISFVSGIPGSKLPWFRNPNYVGRANVPAYKRTYTHIHSHIHFPLGTIVSDRSSRPKFLAGILRPSEWVFQNSAGTPPSRWKTFRLLVE